MTTKSSHTKQNRSTHTHTPSNFFRKRYTCISYFLPAATVYTEMNAISKGVSLGIYEEGKQQGREASKDGSQPYVDLMGRR